MSRRLALVAAVIVAATPLVRADSGPEPPIALRRARVPEAWALSRGEGALVAVVASAGSPWLERVHDVAPGARLEAFDPAVVPGRRRPPDEDSFLALAVGRAVEAGARVLLVPLARREALPRTAEALAAARSRDVLVVAPTGDDGLSHERFPADQPGVVSVAALGSGEWLSSRANAGASTLVAAPGFPEDADGGGAAALVAGAAALALGFDPGISETELRAALGAGPSIGRRDLRGSDGPALLDARELLERLRPRSRAVALGAPWVSPAWVPRGSPARLGLTVRATGRLPVSGCVVARLEGGTRVELVYGPLAPGESVTVERDVVPDARSPLEPLLLPDRRSVLASPLLATLSAGRSATTVAFHATSALEHVPALELRGLAASRGLGVRVRVANASPASAECALVRLVGADGVVLGQSEALELAPGATAELALAGRRSRDDDPPAVRATLELVRRPKAFRETVEAAVPLLLDPLGASRARASPRR